jgi:hypothetical protein
LSLFISKPYFLLSDLKDYECIDYNERKREIQRGREWEGDRGGRERETDRETDRHTGTDR